MALAATIKERTNLDLHNEMIRKAEDLIPVLKKDLNLQTLIEEFLKKLFKT